MVITYQPSYNCINTPVEHAMQAAKPYIHLMRLNKPIGIYLLMWPCLWALWIVYQGTPPYTLLMQFMCGTVIMRSLGCVINDITDKDIDPYVRRTKNRPIANHELTVQNALCLAAVLALLALSILLTLPTSTWYYAAIAAAITAIYPWCKRFFFLSTTDIRYCVFSIHTYGLCNSATHL